MDDIIPQDTPQKQCSKCKQFFPATVDYFFPKGKNSLDLRSACKKCARKLNDADSPMRTCPSCKEEKPNTTEFFYSDRKRCKECVSKKGKDYIKSHKEQHQAFMRTYYVAHKTEYRERDNAFNLRNPEARRRITRTYRMKYPERAITHRRNYFARKKQAQGTHTFQDVLLQYQRQKGKCYYCKAKLSKGKRRYHVDHIVPLTRGGSNGPDNLVIACPNCNSSKHNKLLHEWPKGGRLL